ncbi:hypothetical protein, partial [Klebsiella oxytoca]|uniref:hypothetical protein n=1 Tax=Klebsiella oxytoca TaxID=571 RepID=UPI0013D5A894
ASADACVADAGACAANATVEACAAAADACAVKGGADVCAVDTGLCAVNAGGICGVDAPLGDPVSFCAINVIPLLPSC